MAQQERGEETPADLGEFAVHTARGNSFMVTIPKVARAALCLSNAVELLLTAQREVRFAQPGEEPRDESLGVFSLHQNGNSQMAVLPINVREMWGLSPDDSVQLLLDGANDELVVRPK